jgi:hypothetical protein
MVFDICPKNGGTHMTPLSLYHTIATGESFFKHKQFHLIFSIVKDGTKYPRLLMK